MIHILECLRWYHLPLAVILSFVALTVYLFIVKVILAPYRAKKHFEKQGVKFVKLFGMDVEGDKKRLLDKYGDALITFKQEVDANPNIKMFAFQLGPLVAFSPLDAAYIKEFLTVDYTYYKKHDVLDFVNLLLGKSLISTNGDEWKVLRKLSSKAFHFDVLSANLQAIEETADWLYDRAANGNLEKFDAIDEFQQGTGEVVGKIFFGDNLSKYTVNGKSICLALADLVGEVSACTTSLIFYLYGINLVKMNLLPSHRRALRNIKQFKAACQKIIDAQRKSGKKTQGFLQTFFDAQSDPEYSRVVNDDVIIDQFIVMFIGGTDTTSHVLALAMYYLEKNPEMRVRMEKELDEVWPEGTPVDISKLNKLEYMHAFLKEVLRIAPPITYMIHRQAIKDHKLLDIDIPKGTGLSIAYFAQHVNSKYYKNPEQFDPDRFLRKDPEEGFNKEPFAFMGFSAGPRNCIGQHLAMLKGKIFLAKMVRRFEFKLPADYKLQMAQNDFYEPRNPLVYHLSPKTK
eukprot:CAMPEP_0176430014 /NCGR_PEP_ID=MMETSP0127-20121128/14018_1 /TAXON_ID=938130 /ORGANISM="Platyophrya macrostoma, Strain WH" /LENGTH=513 /DNA_ID=CAMNT_0017811857 /DNA_START=15 /DNA_END=1556 /DNA_ORIENTATION=-